MLSSGVWDLCGAALLLSTYPGHLAHIFGFNLCKASKDGSAPPQYSSLPQLEDFPCTGDHNTQQLFLLRQLSQFPRIISALPAQELDSFLWLVMLLAYTLALLVLACQKKLLSGIHRLVAVASLRIGCRLYNIGLLLFLPQRPLPSTILRNLLARPSQMLFLTLVFLLPLRYQAFVSALDCATSAVLVGLLMHQGRWPFPGISATQYLVRCATGMFVDMAVTAVLHLVTSSPQFAARGTASAGTLDNGGKATVGAEQVADKVAGECTSRCSTSSCAGAGATAVQALTHVSSHVSTVDSVCDSTSTSSGHTSSLSKVTATARARGTEATNVHSAQNSIKGFELYQPENPVAHGSGLILAAEISAAQPYANTLESSGGAPAFTGRLADSSQTFGPAATAAGTTESHLKAKPNAQQHENLTHTLADNAAEVAHSQGTAQPGRPRAPVLWPPSASSANPAIQRTLGLLRQPSSGMVGRPSTPGRPVINLAPLVPGNLHDLLTARPAYVPLFQHCTLHVKVPDPADPSQLPPNFLQRVDMVLRENSYSSTHHSSSSNTINTGNCTLGSSTYHSRASLHQSGCETFRSSSNAVDHNDGVSSSSNPSSSTGIGCSTSASGADNKDGIVSSTSHTVQATGGVHSFQGSVGHHSNPTAFGGASRVAAAHSNYVLLGGTVRKGCIEVAVDVLVAGNETGTLLDYSQDGDLLFCGTNVASLIENLGPIPKTASLLFQAAPGISLQVSWDEAAQCWTAKPVPNILDNAPEVQHPAQQAAGVLSDPDRQALGQLPSSVTGVAASCPATSVSADNQIHQATAQLLTVTSPLQGVAAGSSSPSPGQQLPSICLFIHPSVVDTTALRESLQLELAVCPPSWVQPSTQSFMGSADNGCAIHDPASSAVEQVSHNGSQLVPPAELEASVQQDTSAYRVTARCLGRCLPTQVRSCRRVSGHKPYAGAVPATPLPGCSAYCTDDSYSLVEISVAAADLPACGLLQVDVCCGELLCGSLPVVLLPDPDATAELAVLLDLLKASRAAPTSAQLLCDATAVSPEGAPDVAPKAAANILPAAHVLRPIGNAVCATSAPGGKTGNSEVAAATLTEGGSSSSGGSAVASSSPRANTPVVLSPAEQLLHTMGVWCNYVTAMRQLYAHNTTAPLLGSPATARAAASTESAAHSAPSQSLDLYADTCGLLSQQRTSELLLATGLQLLALCCQCGCNATACFVLQGFLDLGYSFAHVADAVVTLTGRSLLQLCQSSNSSTMVEQLLAWSQQCGYCSWSYTSQTTTEPNPMVGTSTTAAISPAASSAIDAAVLLSPVAAMGSSLAVSAVSNAAFHSDVQACLEQPACGILATGKVHAGVDAMQEAGSSSSKVSTAAATASRGANSLTTGKEATSLFQKHSISQDTLGPLQPLSGPAYNKPTVRNRKYEATELVEIMRLGLEPSCRQLLSACFSGFADRGLERKYCVFVGRQLATPASRGLCLMTICLFNVLPFFLMWTGHMKMYEFSWQVPTVHAVLDGTAAFINLLAPHIMAQQWEWIFLGVHLLRMVVRVLIRLGLAHMHLVVPGRTGFMSYGLYVAAMLTWQQVRLSRSVRILLPVDLAATVLSITKMAARTGGDLRVLLLLAAVRQCGLYGLQLALDYGHRRRFLRQAGLTSKKS